MESSWEDGLDRLDINKLQERSCTMATYNNALKGYVADVPKVIFRRCDGHAYAFDELF